MRIAMVGARGIPATLGGVERVVEQTARALWARGHEVIVYCREPYARPGGQPSGTRTIFTPGLRGKHLDTITHTATALLDVWRRDVDVVHLHSPGPALLSWMPALAGQPLVLTIHAPDWRRDKWSPPAKAVLHTGLACGMRLADAVTAVSSPLAEELSRRYNRPVSYVPNAAAAVRVMPARRIRRWALGSEDYALYVGRIVPEKRLDVLLRAWSRADVAGKLVVVGCAEAGSYGRRCRKLASSDVVFLGGRFGPTLAELYSNAAMVIQPSVLEGMSLVLLEAAAYGRCIVAADIPANRGTMGDSVLYFRGDDVSGLSGQIRRCWECSDLRHEKGRQAQQWVTSRYSWSAAAEQLERIYHQAALHGKVR